MSVEKEDRYVMYIVVRESLNMSEGKKIAQICHFIESVVEDSFRKDWVSTASPFHAYSPWRTSGRTKIILKADEKEWLKLKEIQNHYLIIDAGYTELPENTETVIGFWPMKKSEASSIIKRLRLL